MADAVEVQAAVVEQRNKKQMKDQLRVLLKQRMALEDAALFEPNLDSLVQAGYVTAEMIEDSGRQELEGLGLPLALITKLGRAFGSHGEPTAKPGQALSLGECCKSALCQVSCFPCQAPILREHAGIEVHDTDAGALQGWRLGSQ